MRCWNCFGAVFVKLVFLDAYFRAEVFLMLIFMLKFFDAYFRFFLDSPVFFLMSI